MNKFSKITALGAALAVGMSIPAPAYAGPNPFIGEVMTTSFTFCPRGWQEAAGQVLPVAQYQSVFALLGATYGGNGTSTFALPDLRGRSAIGRGTAPGMGTRMLGVAGGVQYTVLSVSQMPSHTHTGSINVEETSEANSTNPINATIARAAENTYSNAVTPNREKSLAAGSLTIGYSGNNANIGIESPYLPLVQCIAIEGTYPTRD